MKKLVYISFLLLFFACKKEGLTTYDVDDNVYFNYAINTNNYRDSLDFTFAYSDATVQDTTLLLPMAITGAAVNIDRLVDIQIDPASTAMAGTHYEIQPFVIRAGRIRDSIPLLLKRSADLKPKRLKLILRIQANDHFKTGLIYRTGGTSGLDTAKVLQFTVAIGDALTAGPYWVTYSTYFGTFSEKKMRLIHELFGMPLSFWASTSGGNLNLSNAKYYASSMARYLSDQRTKGNTIYEADGVTPMTMGATYQ